MTDRRLIVRPENRITIPTRVRQIVPAVGAVLALTWGIRAVRQRRRRQRSMATIHRVIYRRLTIMQYRGQ